MTDADWYGISATTALGFIALAADPCGNAANKDYTVSNTADTRANLIGKSAFGTDIGALGHDPDYPALSNVVYPEACNGEDGTFINADPNYYKLGETWGDGGTEFTGEYEGEGGGGGRPEFRGGNL